MGRYGYGRVSTLDQHPEAQEDALKAAGCERIWIDHGVSGKLARRPELDACLAYLREGDTLVITKLDRLGRSVKNLIEEIERLARRDVDLIVLDQGIDTTTPSGKLLFHIMAAVAEFEASINRERTNEGLAAARARGRKGGRKEKLSPLQARRMLEMLDERAEDGRHAYTPLQVAKTYGVSRATLYRYRDLQLAAGQPDSNSENGEKQQRQESAGEHGGANLNGR